MMDCNRCEYLNITEDEQRKLPKGKKIGHYCNKYNKPVYHYGHEYSLIPVGECDVDDKISESSVIDEFDKWIW